MGSAEVPTASAAVPDSAELLKALRRASRDADQRGVIRLVERWAELGELPREARLDEARAFLDLRLMDRAWVRLKEQTEANPDDLEALQLIARLYVERGWPTRARKVIERLQGLGVDTAELADLGRRAEQPAVEPPSNARDLERSGSPAQILQLAEVFLATGSFLRARSLLERVRRQQPANARAELLLWGIQGEFIRRGELLSDLLRELDPPAQAPPEAEGEDWDTAEHTDLGDGDPTLAEAETAELSLLPDDREDAPFPSLFRRPAAADIPGPDEEEATVASVLAGMEELRNAPPDTGTDPGGDFSTQGGDTQIMSILPGPGRGVAPVEGPIHQPRDGAPRGLEPLDLKAWQRSMGMPALDSQIPLDHQDAPSEDFLEDEDQDVVVMTRREPVAEGPAPVAAGPRRPIEVIEKFPQPVPPQPQAEDPRPALAAVTAPEPPAFPEEESAVSARTDWARLLIVVALTAGLLVAAGLFLFRAISSVAAGRILDEAERVSADGDVTAMQALHDRLLDEIRGGGLPTWARRLAAGHVALALWDQTGDQRMRDEARGLLAQADDAPRVEHAELESALALAAGDLARAEVLLDDNPALDLWGRALRARVALDRGDPARALDLWSPVADSASGVAHRLLWADILAANGRDAETRAVRSALVSAHGDEPMVFLPRQQQGWEGGEPEARLSALEGWLDQRRDALTPRNLARAQEQRAALLSELGLDEQADFALASALEADPMWSPALYRRAARRAGQGDTAGAIDDLQRCLDTRPGDGPCRRGLVQLLLSEGRQMEAADVVRDTLDPRADAVLRGWLAAVSGDARRALELVPEPSAGAGAPLIWVVRATALSALGTGEDERRRAAAALADSEDPMDRLLNPTFGLGASSVRTATP